MECGRGGAAAAAHADSATEECKPVTDAPSSPSPRSQRYEPFRRSDAEPNPLLSLKGIRSEISLQPRNAPRIAAGASEENFVLPFHFKDDTSNPSRPLNKQDFPGSRRVRVMNLDNYRVIKGCRGRPTAGFCDVVSRSKYWATASPI